MRYILTFAIAIIATVSLAQTPHEIVWSRTMGTTADEPPGGYDESKVFIDVNSENEIFVLSNFANSPENNWLHNPIGDWDAWLIKLNEDGDTLWTKAIGGTGEDCGLDVLAMPDGGCVIAGFTKSNDGDMIGNHDADGSDYDGFIIRYDADGNKLWGKLYGGGGDVGGWDQIYRIRQKQNGNLIAAGTSNSINGDLPFDITKYQAGWLLEVNAETGAKVKTKRIAGQNHDEWNANKLWDIHELPDQSGYVTFGEQVYMLPSNVWFAKVSTNLDTIWSKEYKGGQSDNFPRGMGLNADGTMVFATYTVGQVEGTTPFDGSDIWIMKSDSEGNIIDQTILGGNSYEMLYRFAPNNKGGYLVAASSRSTDGLAPGTIGESDMYLVNIDANLDTLSTYKLGGTSSDALTDVRASASGEVWYLGGRTESNDVDVSGNNGGVDVWVAKIGEEPSSAEVITNDKQIQIYPNPASESVFIKQNSENFITITDILGKIVYKSANQASAQTISVKNWTKGIYFVKTKEYSEKLIIR